MRLTLRRARRSVARTKTDMDPKPHMDEIPVVLPFPVETAKGTGTKARFLGGEKSSMDNRIQHLDAAKLRESLGALSGQIASVLQDIKKVGDYQLTAVEVSVEVTAEGGVALIGSLKAGAKGAIKLRFERPTG